MAEYLEKHARRICSEVKCWVSRYEDQEQKYRTMGINVVALNPLHSNDETISRFDASRMAWSVLHAAMVTCCRDILGDELLHLMNYNDGHGPGDAETCRKIAYRIDSMVTDLRLEDVFAQYDWTEASWDLDIQCGESGVEEVGLKLIGVPGPSGPVPAGPARSHQPNTSSSNRKTPVHLEQQSNEQSGR